MSEKSIELSSVNPSDPSASNDVKVETHKESLKPVSVSTLFFSHATKGQILVMWLGYICALFPPL